MADFIKVSLEYYDEAEKEKLLNYPDSEKISALVKNGVVDIPIVDFYLNYQSYYKNSGAETQESLLTSISKGVVFDRYQLEKFFEFDDGEIYLRDNILSAPPSNMAEKIGEAIGLSVMNYLFGMTQFDWAKIPENNKAKSLDYSGNVLTASTERYYVQVENKGSIVLDDKLGMESSRFDNVSVDLNKDVTKGKQVKSAPIYSHKSSVIAKKEEQARPSSICFGTISEVGKRSNGGAKCWLLDPPAEEFLFSPKKARLIHRYLNVVEWICSLHSRSSFAAVLRNRLSALMTLEDPYVLDSLPLKKGNGKLFNSFFSDLTEGPVSIEGKSAIKAEGVIGECQVINEEIYFIGVASDWYNVMVEQSFSKIISFKSPVSDFSGICKVVLKDKDFESLGFEVVRLGKIPGVKTKKYAELVGEFGQSSSGIVYGHIQLESRNRLTVNGRRSNFDDY